MRFAKVLAPPKGGGDPQHIGSGPLRRKGARIVSDFVGPVISHSNRSNPPRSDLPRYSRIRHRGGGSSRPRPRSDSTACPYRISRLAASPRKAGAECFLFGFDLGCGESSLIESCGRLESGCCVSVPRRSLSRLDERVDDRIGIPGSLLPESPVHPMIPPRGAYQGDSTEEAPQLYHQRTLLGVYSTSRTSTLFERIAPDPACRR